MEKNDFFRCNSQFLYAGIFYSILVFIIFAKPIFSSQNQLLFGDDIHHEHIFTREMLMRELRSGVIPFWNPYQFAGTPFLANPQEINLGYPLKTLIFLVLPTHSAYAVFIALHIWIACMGMFFIVKRHTGLIAGLASGIVYGLNGFIAARIYAGHVDIIMAASLAPWVVGWFIRGCESGSRKAVVISGVMLAFQLTGYQTIAFFTMIIVAVTSFVQSIFQRSIRPLFLMCIGTLFGFGFMAIQLLPMQEFIRSSIRTYPMPYSWSSYGAMTVENLKQLIDPFAEGDQYSYTGSPPNYGEHAMFVGRIGLGLALFVFIFFIAIVVSAVLKKPVRDGMKLSLPMSILTLSSAILIVFSLWISFAKHTPFDLQKVLWNIIPTYRILRFPTRHLFIFVFAVAVLSGIGLSRIKKSALQLVILGLMLIEMIPFALHFIVIKPAPQTKTDGSLIQTVIQDTLLQARVLPNFALWLHARDSLEFNAGMQYKYFSTTGYDPTIYKPYYEFIDATLGNTPGTSIDTNNVQVPYMNLNSPFVDFLNIKYIYMPYGYDENIFSASKKFRLVNESREKEYQMYENNDVLPRFFLVPKLHVLSDKHAVMESVRTMQFDPHTEVVTDITTFGWSSGFTSSCDISTGNVKISHYGLNDISLSVNSPCDAVLATSEIMYPGWTAAVDGKKSPLFEGNMTFRTLMVPAGKHIVTMQYQPTIFIYGGIISAITVCIAVVFVKMGSRKI